MTEFFEHMWWVVAIVSHTICLSTIVVSVAEGVDALGQDVYVRLIRLLSLIGVVYTWASVVV